MMTVAATKGRETILLAPVTQTANITATANLDTKDASYATIRIPFASEINTSAIGPTISLLHSDDTVVTNFATITADRTAEDLTAAKQVIYHIDMRGKKRYLRLSLTSETHTTNDLLTFFAGATLTRLEEAPASTSGMVASGDVVVTV